MSDVNVIETSDLHKRYDGPGDTDALRGLTLQVPRGSIFGFLGTNGAGKTTTIKILLGMTHATSGSATVLGLPAGTSRESVAIRQRTGFVSEDRDLFDTMTVDETIRFTASFYPAWQRDTEVKYRRAFELPADRLVKDLSRGARTKLALVAALCRGAELLVLDEPTSGLDPAATEEVLQMLVGHVARDGVTVFLSTHHLSDVDQIADSLAIVDHGRVAVAGSLDALHAAYRRVQWVFEGDAPQPSFQTPGVMRVERRGRVLTAFVKSGVDALVQEGQQLRPASVEVLPVSLKEIFLETVAVEN